MLGRDTPQSGVRSDPRSRPSRFDDAAYRLQQGSAVLGESLPREGVLSACSLQGRGALSQLSVRRSTIAKRSMAGMSAEPPCSLHCLDQADPVPEALDLGCRRFGLFGTSPGGDPSHFGVGDDVVVRGGCEGLQIAVWQRYRFHKGMHLIMYT